MAIANSKNFISTTFLILSQEKSLSSSLTLPKLSLSFCSTFSTMKSVGSSSSTLLYQRSFRDSIRQLYTGFMSCKRLRNVTSSTESFHIMRGSFTPCSLIVASGIVRCIPVLIKSSFSLSSFILLIPAFFATLERLMFIEVSKDAAASVEGLKFKN